MERSRRYAARTFAITYFLSFAIIMVAFSRFYAPYLVWENGEETARHFIGHEQAIRLYLAGAFLYAIGIFVLFTSLYSILRPVNRRLVFFAVFAKLTYALFWLVSLLDVFGALHLLRSAGSLQRFGQDGLAVLAGLQLDSSRDAYYIGFVFNGLGSALFAWVLFQSRFIPRALALWGVMSSLYEGCCGFAYLIHPSVGAILSPNWYELPAVSFELLLCLWFLFGRLGAPPAVPARPQSGIKAG